jgi:hypothetical protein
MEIDCFLAHIMGARDSVLVYESDMSRRAARVNVGLALLHIKNSIIDAIDKAREIGNCKETDYAPISDIDPANIKLRKD